MNLTEIETILRERRLSNYKYFKSNLMGSRDLQPSVVQNIENGGNYKLISLFKYIKALNLRLIVEDTTIMDPIDFGQTIKSYRRKNNMTQFQVVIKCNFNPTKISRLEKGICSRNSLNTWLTNFPDFKIEVTE